MTISVIKGSDNVNYNLRDDVHTWGGRNLALQTTTSKTCTQSGSNSYYAPVGLWSISEYGRASLTNTNNLYFTISFDWTSSNVTTATTLGCTLKYSSTSYSDSGAVIVSTTGNSLPTGSSSGHFCKVFKPSDAQRTYGTMFLLGTTVTSNTSASVVVSNFKFECGNKSTDWSPAPEDIAHVNGECLELLS